MKARINKIKWIPLIGMEKILNIFFVVSAKTMPASLGI
jgi:hypothetical protein